jgi:hypothetical protein
VSEPDIIRLIRRLARAGDVIYSEHALLRMWERSASQADVMHVLVYATIAREQSNGRWRIVGADLDGDELTVVVVIDGDAIVVTVF